MSELMQRVPLEGLASLLLMSYSTAAICLMCLMTGMVVWQIYRPNPSINRVLFWIFGGLLAIFIAVMPPEISRDGLGYVRDVVPDVCGMRSCNPAAHPLRDVFWYASISLLRGIFGDERVAFVLAAVGLLIKLWVIDKICINRLLALMLLIPLAAIQYDFTQLRAGFALSWYFLGVYLIARNRVLPSVSVMGSNFLWHAQALPSIGIYPIYWLNRSLWVVPLSVCCFLLLLALGIYPTIGLLSSFQIGLGSEGYIAAAISGQYSGVKLFPIGYIPILGYAIWIISVGNNSSRLIRVVGGSIILAVFLAWLVAANPVMQGRMFEFYVAPLVLLVGNLFTERYKIYGAIVLSWILYFRLEVLHDWILG